MIRLSCTLLLYTVHCSTDGIMLVFEQKNQFRFLEKSAKLLSRDTLFLVQIYAPNLISAEALSQTLQRSPDPLARYGVSPRGSEGKKEGREEEGKGRDGGRRIRILSQYRLVMGLGLLPSRWHPPLPSQPYQTGAAIAPAPFYTVAKA